MKDRRFNLCVSVGLIVLAPSPDAWWEGCPGTTDIRLPEAGVVAPDFPALGERGAIGDAELWSGERVLSADALPWLIRFGGGADNVLSFAVRDAVMLREVSG